MMDLDMHCPVHDKDETLHLKDAYWYFRGVVECGNPEGEGSPMGPQMVKIEIEKGTIASVAPVERATA